jgi:hypothetical protein
MQASNIGLFQHLEPQKAKERPVEDDAHQKFD